MTTKTITVPQDQPGDIDDTLRQARTDAANGDTVQVTFWDATSDPKDPGWLRRTYSLDDTDTVEYVDEIL